MTLLGLVGTTATLPAPEPAATPVGELQVRLDDGLASPHRLWLRGQVLKHPAGPDAGGPRRWWKRNGTPPAPPPSLHLEARLGGTVLEADVPVGDAGQFEASFTTPLPPSRRGWRLVRNQLSYLGRTVEQCTV